MGEEQIGDVHLDQHALPLALLIGALDLGLRRRRLRLLIEGAEAAALERLGDLAADPLELGVGRRVAPLEVVGECGNVGVEPLHRQEEGVSEWTEFRCDVLELLLWPPRRAVGAVRLGLRRLERREERIDALEQLVRRQVERLRLRRFWW